ncbi:niemann-Pick C1-like protein 1-like [Hibiscus syriacus]|uniref:Niemann-Pick C1-like protein 1-like n=1 Tax=Hibiscus syriacus TaxID=106335 RepID=A0A6A2WVY2_HIBSY|nr:niemann-Pick C1-like protein 1-like [Hibiscus syriacus]
MELDTVKDAFDSVVKRQKLSFSKSQEIVDQLGLQKERNINHSKYPKLLEKSFNPDISKAYGYVDFDFHIANQIVANLFNQQGLFDLGDSLVDEAGEPEAISIRSHFLDMYQVLEYLKVKDLEPALNWIAVNREKLNQNGSCSSLELKLHRLQFVEIVKKGTKADALSYARTRPIYFSAHDKFQKLVVCIIWSYRSPLSVLVAAGIEGLPTLLKLVNVIAAKRQEWLEMKQLPVPVELGKELQFHSIFVCPVSRDQDSEENPPMQMPCLHVLCKQSIMKLSKSRPWTFRCPYCPTEVSAEQCRQLYF